MNTFITKTNITGIKNLSEPISLEFYKTNYGNKIIIEKNNIKAIYGANGAGKSAIIHAYDIFEEIVSKKGQLFTEDFARKLDELVNKETKIFSIDISFFVYDDQFNIFGEYNHAIKVGKDDFGYNIISEQLKLIKKKRETVIISTNQGLIVESILGKKFNDFIVKQCTKRSVIDLFTDLFFMKDPILNLKDIEQLQPFLKFNNNLVIQTVKEDNHLGFVYRKHHSKNEESWDKYSNDLYNWIKKSRNLGLSSYSFYIPAEQIEEFESYIKGLERFIKIFKPNLIRIDISQRKQNNNEFCIEPHFIYEKNTIHLEFESAGIKKLVNLYQLFCDKEEGKTIIIDELDANINDVYLMKILEYFNNNPTGQMIFTTHNVTPMYVLAKNKNAIDFITMSGKISSWVRKGNYSPINIYQNGYIKGLPFNIYESDFIGIFSNE